MSRTYALYNRRKFEKKNTDEREKREGIDFYCISFFMKPYTLHHKLCCAKQRDVVVTI